MVIYGMFGSDMQEVFMVYFKVYATISMKGLRTTCNTSGRVALSMEVESTTAHHSIVMLLSRWCKKVVGRKWRVAKK